MLTQTDKARDLAARFGGSGAEGGEFAPGGVRVSEIAERYGSPFYLYDAGMISERVQRVQDALGTEVAYSLKANPNLSLIHI